MFITPSRDARMEIFVQIPQMAQRANKDGGNYRAALFSRFQHAFRDIIRQLSNSELDEDGVDSIIFRLEQLSIHLVRLCNVDLMNNQSERIFIGYRIYIYRLQNGVEVECLLHGAQRGALLIS